MRRSIALVGGASRRPLGAATEAVLRRERHGLRRATPAIGVVACLLTGCGDDGGGTASTKTQAAPAPVVTAVQPPPRRQREPAGIVAARAAVDRGSYRRAIALAARRSSASERAIRERIANRIARQALGAVRARRPDDARALLRQADRYPSTDLAREARIAYADAQARAQQRARDLQAQAQQSIRRRSEDARRAEAQRAMERTIRP